MSILNIGSLNIDLFYQVPHFVRPGETLPSLSFHTFCGGKGLNQSIAAARAGARVMHAGAAGPDGQRLLDMLTGNGVDVSRILRTDVPQGHAVIQTDPKGENCILLFPGSNYALDRETADRIFASLEGPCMVILQNEVSELPYLIEKAHAAGCPVVFNASPFDESLMSLDYGRVRWLMINEIEGKALTGSDRPEEIADILEKRFPGLGVVLTLGGDGCLCRDGGQTFRQPVFHVEAVDTTGAGDTFTGYFAAALDREMSLPEALRRAAAAAAISVTRRGAAPSIPAAGEVEAFLDRA